MTNLNFTNFPVLTTERLTLRQLSVEDTKDIFVLRTDPDINKYLNRPPCQTEEDAIHFINKVNDNIKNNTALYWAITQKSSKTFVGTICIFDFSDENKSCELGYELMTKFQGKGIMSEAVQSVIEFVFQSMGFRKIVAFSHSDNQNSGKLLSKFNFVKSLEPDNENPDVNVFTLTH